MSDAVKAFATEYVYISDRLVGDIIGQLDAAKGSVGIGSIELRPPFLALESRFRDLGMNRYAQAMRALPGLANALKAFNHRKGRKYRVDPSQPSDEDVVKTMVLEGAHVARVLDQDEDSPIGVGHMEVFARVYYGLRGRVQLRNLRTYEVEEFDGVYLGTPIWVRTLPRFQNPSEDAPPGYGGMRIIRDAIEQAAESNKTIRAERAIERYQDAFENGALDSARFKERLTALDTRLDALTAKTKPSPMNSPQTRPQRSTRPRSKHVADQLGQVIATGDTNQTKTLLCSLIADLRVNSRAEILLT